MKQFVIILERKNQAPHVKLVIADATEQEILHDEVSRLDLDEEHDCLTVYEVDEAPSLAFAV